MKNFSLLFLVVLCSLIGCSKSENAQVNENMDLAPSSFTISNDEVGDKSATIVWSASNDPENKTVTYTLYLGDSLLVTNTSALSYSLEDLVPETSYAGRIEASDGTNSTFANFTFTTKEIVPVPFTGDMILVSQQEVIEFGDQGYTEISGSLTIRDSGWPSDFYITDLIPLKELTKIDGNLVIERNYRLKNLKGLERITSIDGEFIIKNNIELSSLKGLEGLISIGENFEIVDSYELIDVDGLMNLSIIGGDLIIAAEGINSLKGLRSLSNVGLDIGIYDVEELTNLLGLEGITSIGNLDINDCNKLESFAGLDNLTEVLGRMDIRDNNSLINFEGLSNLKAVRNGFDIIYNNSLEELKGLEGLTTIEWSFTIDHNAKLENLDALVNLTSVYYDLRIESNESLFNLCGIQPLLVNNGLTDYLSISSNGYNPAREWIIEGNCSQ